MNAAEDEMVDDRPHNFGTCISCGTKDAPVDSQGICWPCFEDAMFAPDEEES